MEIEKNDYVEGGRDQLVRIATWALAIILPVAIVYLRRAGDGGAHDSTGA